MNSKKKECSKCFDSYPLNCFFKKKDNKDGLDGQCKYCKAKRRKERIMKGEQVERITKGKGVDRLLIINQEITKLRALKNQMNPDVFLKEHTEDIETLILKLALITGNDNHTKRSNKLKEMAWNLLELNYNGYDHNLRRKNYQEKYLNSKKS